VSEYGQAPAREGGTWTFVPCPVNHITLLRPWSDIKSGSLCNREKNSISIHCMYVWHMGANFKKGCCESVELGTRQPCTGP